MGCLYDSVDCVWLAPDEHIVNEVSQWPDIIIGTPGPRIARGYYRGFAALDLPHCAATELRAVPTGTVIRISGSYCIYGRTTAVRPIGPGKSGSKVARAGQFVCA